jgi:anti-anti-sigma factor
MTVMGATSGTAFASRFGNPPADCDGVRMRALSRQLATVVTVSGDVDAVNIDRVSQYTRRFVLAEKPFVLDLSGVDSFATQAVPLLYDLDDDCGTAGVEWALIASHPVVRRLSMVDDSALFPIVNSVPAALQHFAESAHARQRLLPLLSKSA